MLRYSADRRTIAFVATYFALLAAGYLLPWGHWPLRFALVAVTALFSFFCAVITHNTVHAPIFHSRWANKIFQVVLSLCYGHPVSAFVPGHNLSHHKWTQTTRDIMRTTKVRHRWNLFNQLLFTSTVGRAVLTSEIGYAWAMRRQRPRWVRQLLGESVLFLGAMIALLLVDWRCFLLHVLVPHLYAAWGIVGINFVQHDGADATSPYNHSRNFVGTWVNWWTFNNGYHGIHHVHPSLHWSLLPAAHAAELHPYIHPNLEQRALVPYLWSSFIWPGQRLTYDGRLLIPEPAGSDEPWWNLAESEELTAEANLGAEG